MTPQERDQIFDNLFQGCKQLLVAKGVDYAGITDCLANFKEEAEDLGISKYQVWGVYFNKHRSSIKNAIKANPHHPTTSSEPLSGRIKDAINYLGLLQCMLLEDERLSQVGKIIETDDPTKGIQ